MLDAAAPKSAAASPFSTAAAPVTLGASAFSAPSPAPTAAGSSAPELMAHEAAHVVQQSAGRASASPYAGMF